MTALFEEGEPPTPELVHEALRPVLTQFFRPALLGRMSVIPFMPIVPEVMAELVELKLSHVGERLKNRHRLNLSWDEEVIGNIAASCTAVDTGARNIDHIINANLLPLIAASILGALDSQDTPHGLHISLDVEAGTFTCSLR